MTLILRNETSAPSALLVLGFLVMLGVNVFFTSYPPAARKQMSTVDIPVYLLPSGPTFAIWGLVYLLNILLIIQNLRFSFLGGESSLFLTNAPRMLLFLSYFLNAAWLPLDYFDLHVLSVVDLYFYAFILALVYYNFRIEYGQPTTSVSITEYELWAAIMPKGQAPWAIQIMTYSAISVNLAWVFVAANVNVTTTGLYKILNIPTGPNFAIAAMAFITLVSLVLLVSRNDIPYTVTTIWALNGIIDRAGGDKSKRGGLILSHDLVNAGRICIALLTVISFWRLYIVFRSKDSKKNV